MRLLGVTPNLSFLELITEGEGWVCERHQHIYIPFRQPQSLDFPQAKLTHSSMKEKNTTNIPTYTKTALHNFLFIFVPFFSPDVLCYC